MQSFSRKIFDKARLISFNLVLLFLACICFSQDRNNIKEQPIDRSYRDFRNVFDKEIEEMRQRRSDELPRVLFDAPETLPGWLFEIPEACPDSVYVFGISDPGMDNNSGLRLAIQRACLILLLTNELQFANMRDYYSRDRDGVFSQTYMEYSELVTSAKGNIDQAEVIQHHITNFGETIVLLQVPKQKSAGSIAIDTPQQNVFASLYTQFRLFGRTMQIDEKLYIAFSFESEHTPVELDHHYIKINQITNSRTLENNVLVSDLPALRLRYRNTGNQNEQILNNDTILQYGKCLNNGLWHAWISGFLHEMADVCHQGSIHFSNLSDIYLQLSQSLNREYASRKLQLHLPVMHITDNKLILDF